MQIVIDIPENELTEDEIQECIRIAEVNFSNVTLIKGEHGDLIDRDTLEPDCYELEIHDGDDWRNEYCGVSLMQLQYYAEVIIPATKEKNK